MPDVYYKAEDEPLYYSAHLNRIRYRGNYVIINKLSPGSGIVFRANGRYEAVGNIEEASSLNGCEPFLPALPRDVSMESCVDDNEEYCVSFAADLFMFPIDFESLKEKGHFLESGVFPIYHNYVLWAYTLRLTREEGDSFVVSMRSLGSHLGGKGKNGLSNYYMDGPRLVEAELTIHHQGNTQETTTLYLRYTDDSSYYYVDKKFTEQELRSFGDESCQLHVSLRLLIPRSFFSLKSIIDLNHKPTVPASAQHTVKLILQGQKQRGNDLKMTGSREDCKCSDRTPPKYKYFVHKSAFAKCNLDYIFEDESIAMREARVNGICDHALRLVIPIAYGAEAPLPPKGSYILRMVRTLTKVFGDVFVKEVVPQWEREICRTALAMDKRNPSSSMTELLHLLNIVWSMPEGQLSVAKRISIGVLADMAHLNARSSLQQWVSESVLPHVEESGCGNEYVAGILTVFHKVMNTVPLVEKKIVRLVVDEWPS